MRWFFFLSALIIVYYLCVAIYIITLDPGEYYFENLPLASIFLVSVVTQIGLIIGLHKQINVVLTCWLIYTCVELMGVIATFICLQNPQRQFLYFPLYLLLKLYSLFRVCSFIRDIRNASEYEPLY